MLVWSGYFENPHLKTFINGFQTSLKIYKNKEIFMSPSFSKKNLAMDLPLIQDLSYTIYHDMIIREHLFTVCLLVGLIVVYWPYLSMLIKCLCVT
jgi:hypothetical protein